MKITVKDNFFNCADQLRDIALSLDRWVKADTVEHPQGWRGLRTLPLREYKIELLDSITEQLFNYLWIVHDLNNWRYPPYTDPVNPPSRLNNFLQDPMISTYFHQAPAYIINSRVNFNMMKYHADYLSCAGVIYLTPNAPEDGGTSILDFDKNKIINIENKYNRLVAYDGFNTHAPSNVFGNDLNTNRLTLTFFIHEKDDEEEFKQRDEEFLDIEEIKKLPDYEANGLLAYPFSS